MSVFIAITAALTLLVVIWFVWPLLRPAAQDSVSIQRLNASIYRDQLEALDRDLASGAISAADHEVTRDELQLRLLDDTEAPQATSFASPSAFWSAKRTAGAIAVALPLLSGAMYWWLGTPAALEPKVAQGVNAEKIGKMVETLAARLQANPDNPKGWAMLARSYKVMGRLEEAEQAYLKAGEEVTKNPDMLVDFAEVLAMRADNRMAGRPLELVNQALALDPEHPSALMMSGVADYQRADFAAAIAQWEKLLSVLEPGSADAEMTQSNIDEARTRMKSGPQGKTKP